MLRAFLVVHFSLSVASGKVHLSFAALSRAHSVQSAIVQLILTALSNIPLGGFENSNGEIL